MNNDWRGKDGRTLTAYVLENYATVPESGCWLWLGGWDKEGYGRISKEGVQTKAHRAFYEIHVGQIPAGMLVCHRCDTPSCVNPNHLFLGTNRDNVLDKVKKGRYSRVPAVNSRWRKKKRAATGIDTSVASMTPSAREG